MPLNEKYQESKSCGLCAHSVVTANTKKTEKFGWCGKDGRVLPNNYFDVMPPPPGGKSNDPAWNHIEPLLVKPWGYCPEYRSKGKEDTK